MPSDPKPPDDEVETPEPNSNTPARRKSSAPNSTPRRASAVKRPNASPKTPIRKASGNVVKTPNTAPARAKTGGKKPEPTLLGDFLLGRPSPARQQRRKSLDAVKQELKAANVGTIKVPGGVKDRVKQWQKTSAAAAVEDPNAELDEGLKAKTKAEGVEDGSVDEGERLRVKYRGAKRPGRRKSKDEDAEAKEGSENTSGSRSAPRKRVISDDHWMMKSPKKSPPNKRNTTQGIPIPKDFLTKSAVKEPLGQRVQDWIKLSENQGLVVEQEVVKPKSRKPSRKELPDDGIRIKPSPKEEEPPVKLKGDGIRVKPLDDSPKESFTDDGIRVKPIRKDDSKRRPKNAEEEDEEETRTPNNKREKHLRPSTDFTTTSRASSRTSRKLDDEDRDQSTPMTPSPPEKSKRKLRKPESESELSDIPFGNSAFSVLELPVGAEAGNLRRPLPKRTPSFGVPKVLKKVYNAVHDGPEPSRAGPNQPASIESWLNGTTDPFVERPTPPESVLEIPDAFPSRKSSYQKNDETERELTVDRENGTVRRKRRPRKSLEEAESDPKDDVPPLENPKTRDTLPSMDQTPLASPTGLKRSPATRNSSTPKAARKSLFKHAIFDAFKGESGFVGESEAGYPFAEITGLRERDVNRAPEPNSIREPIYEEESSKKYSPPPSEKRTFSDSSQQRERLPFLPRGPPPTSGGHRLSTIASVETFSTSSVTDTASELSQTTITQDTVLTRPTSSSISRKSNKPRQPAMKPRLTKHSDLLSVLSLPDSAQQGRSKSIRSARSIRTMRPHLETATSQELMKEVSEDEAKYIRELNTLVDGVIPVLLTCVLSKSDSAAAAGLFDKHSNSPTDPSLTKPIVDMGIALERLKSLHKRIPLENPDAFVIWANQAHKTYQDYLAAWRTGFQDVVVNLAPASPTASATPTPEEMERNSEGDLIGTNGERVDVAYLLKRPLVRGKYICRVLKGFSKLNPSDTNEKTAAMWETYQERCRIRVKEEAARQVDLAANSTDTTRARDPRTLFPVEGCKIDKTRQVYAKDFFNLDFSHSNGQRLECHVEIILRDKALNPTDSDILICEVTESRKFLLFPPITKDLISSRPGAKQNELIVMIRGDHDSTEWRETLLLVMDDEGDAQDWVEMLGTDPLPPQIAHKDIHNGTGPITNSLDNNTPSIPIGERIRREAEESATPKRQTPQQQSRDLPTVPSMIKEESVVSEGGIVDLNDAMTKAGSAPKRPRAARYHGRTNSTPTTFVAEMSGALNPYPNEAPTIFDQSKSGQLRGADNLPYKLPYIPKTRSEPTTPLKEHMRPELGDTKKKQSPVKNDDAPPPPPPHRTLTPTGLKDVPVLDTPTQKVKRRSSSPLKHEYQPSDASGTSSSEETDSDSNTFSESSDDDELEEDDVTTEDVPTVPIYNNQVSTSNSTKFSSTILPQLPALDGAANKLDRTPSMKLSEVEEKFIATISGWAPDLGKWIDLHPEPCSIVVLDGRIKVFELSSSHASPARDLIAQACDSQVSLASKHILDQVLTPVVPLRKSTAVDIEITSAPTSEIKSIRAHKSIRYRTSTTGNCQLLYNAVHKSRLNNPEYKKLELDRRLSGYGQRYDNSQQDRRRSFFGRKRSYRASTRAPTEVAESERSGNSRSSVASALRRLSGTSVFNIAKSSIDRNSVAASTYTSNPSDWSGLTPPRTPNSGSVFGSLYSTGFSNPLSNEDLKIRLYHFAGSSKWADLGPARLSITNPPAGRRQASSLYQGMPRHLIVRQRQPKPFINELFSPKETTEDSDKEAEVIMDIVLGAECFTRMGRSGVVVNIWEEATGPNGEIGRVGAVGGLSGRTRKYAFQTHNSKDANWIYSLATGTSAAFPATA